MGLRKLTLGCWLLVAACGGQTSHDIEWGSGGSGGIPPATGGLSGLGGVSGSGGISGSGGSAGCAPGTDLSANPDHCGSCGHSCLGGACENGVCQPVVLADLGLEGATALALDDSHVYWASPLNRMDKNGNGVTWLAAASGSVFGVAVDEQTVYFTSIDYGLFSVSKAGGAPMLLGEAGYRVALDATHVYTVWDGVRKLPKQGGPSVSLADIGGQGIAIDETFVYFSTWNPGGLWRVPKNGGAVEQLAQIEYASYVAEYADHVYFTSQGSTTAGVRSVPKSGGAVTLLATAATPYGIAADQTGVYWTEYDGGAIWMQPAAGGPTVKLASGQFFPRDLAVDELAVYWTNDANYSAVSRVAKP